MKTLNFFKTFLLSTILVVLGFGLFSCEVQAQTFERSSVGTIVIAESEIELRDIEIPGLIILPSVIDEGDDMIFQTDPVFFEGTTEVAVGISCKINITTGEGEVVILEGETDSFGVCSFDTSLTPSEQGLTVVSGDVSKINTDIGVGEAKVVFTHKDEDLETAIENFTVNEVESIDIGDFEITEEEIEVGDGINLRIGPIISPDGDPIPDLPLRIVIELPDGSELILEGETNDDGELEFDSSKDLGEQGIEVIQGDVEDISDIAGDFVGYVEAEYEGEVYKTNFDSYVVKSEDVMPEVVRTGAFGGGLVILVVIFVLTTLYLLKNYQDKNLKEQK